MRNEKYPSIKRAGIGGFTPAYAGKRPYDLSRLPLIARITPAYAGKRKQHLPSILPQGDHPRIRGEKANANISTQADQEDHPRIRGESEKITVRACAGKYEHQHIVFDAIDQEPIRGDVAFAITFVIPGKRMVAILFRQRSAAGKCFNHSVKQRYFQAALFCELIVLLEHRGELDDKSCFSHLLRSAKSS